MRRRRVSPYSQAQTSQRSRQELVTLIALTIGLGMALNLLATFLGADLGDWLPCKWVRYLVTAGLTLLLAGWVFAYYYTSAETDWVPMEIQLPYHLPGKGDPEVLIRGSYGVTRSANQAFRHRYGSGSGALRDWQAAWARAREAETSFQDFVAEDHAALVQCMLLYALHRYGDASLGDEANYGWHKVDLRSRSLGLGDLPADLRSNPFLLADLKAREWRLLLPAGVDLELVPEEAGPAPFPRWRLRHARYGTVEIRWYPFLGVAGRGSQAYRVLTQRATLGEHSKVFAIATRLEARAKFRWPFFGGAEAFQEWATNLMAYLEEALDWGYYLATRSDRIIAHLEERVGGGPDDLPLHDRMKQVEARLERMERALEGRNRDVS